MWPDLNTIISRLNDVLANQGIMTANQQSMIANQNLSNELLARMEIALQGIQDGLSNLLMFGGVLLAFAGAMFTINTLINFWRGTK